MKRYIMVMLIAFLPFWDLLALELKIEGSFLVGSYPNDIHWLTDDVIAMGSSNGFHVFNVKTEKHDILFTGNRTYIKFSDDRDGFCVVSTGNDVWLYFSTGRILPMANAVKLYQEGKLPLKYFKDYYAYPRGRNVSIDLDATSITVRMLGFDEKDVFHVIPIEGFDGTIITERYVPDTNKQVENDPVPWIYKKGTNTLHDFFDYKTGNAFAQVNSPIFNLVTYDFFYETIVLRSDIYAFRVVIRNGLGYIKQIKFDTKEKRENPSFNWMLTENPPGIVSLTTTTYITRDWFSDGLMLGEDEFLPICVKNDDGLMIQRLDSFLLDYSLPVSVNWNRTRIAAIALNTEIKESCIAVFSVICDGIVNDSSVRMRSSPGLGGKVLQVLGKGENVKILDYSKDQETISGTTAYWYKISTSSGKDGWVFGAFVDYND